jgi:hypothetical protein
MTRKSRDYHQEPRSGREGGTSRKVKTRTLENKKGCGTRPFEEVTAIGGWPPMKQFRFGWNSKMLTWKKP